MTLFIYALFCGTIAMMSTLLSGKAKQSQAAQVTTKNSVTEPQRQPFFPECPSNNTWTVKLRLLLLSHPTAYGILGWPWNQRQGTPDSSFNIRVSKISGVWLPQSVYQAEAPSTNTMFRLAPSCCQGWATAAQKVTDLPGQLQVLLISSVPPPP